MYEKRVHSPHASPVREMQYGQAEWGDRASQLEFVDQSGYAKFSVPEKRKLPIGWIIGIAVAIPLFVIMILFLAVWLQEMGLI